MEYFNVCHSFSKWNAKANSYNRLTDGQTDGQTESQAVGTLKWLRYSFLSIFFVYVYVLVLENLFLCWAKFIYSFFFSILDSQRPTMQVNILKLQRQLLGKQLLIFHQSSQLFELEASPSF